MWCENWNFDNNECQNNTPVISAEDFTASVNKCANDAIKCRELWKMWKIPEDELPSLDFTSQAWPQLWNWYNWNASNKVTFPERTWWNQSWNIQTWPWIRTGNIYQNNPNGSIYIWVEN